MLTHDSTTEVRPLSGAGLLAGQYYDPYPPRFAANLKEILAAGMPMVMRIHPGVRYPMSDAELFDRVDLEGHVAAYVGYDHERGTISIADPWPSARFGGSIGGLHDEPEEVAVGTIPVNSTLDYATTALPLPVAISLSSITESVVEIHATVRTELPHAIRTSVSGLENLVASVRLPDGMSLIGERRRRADVLPAGTSVTLGWTASLVGTVEGRIEVAVAGLAHGDEPYPFSDVIGGHGLLRVRSADRVASPAAW